MLVTLLSLLIGTRGLSNLLVTLASKQFELVQAASSVNNLDDAGLQELLRRDPPREVYATYCLKCEEAGEEFLLPTEFNEAWRTAGRMTYDQMISSIPVRTES